jgi:hypothetical protein
MSVAYVKRHIGIQAGDIGSSFHSMVAYTLSNTFSCPFHRARLDVDARVDLRSSILSLRISAKMSLIPFPAVLLLSGVSQIRSRTICASTRHVGVASFIACMTMHVFPMHLSFSEPDRDGASTRKRRIREGDGDDPGREKAQRNSAWRARPGFICGSCHFGPSPRWRRCPLTAAFPCRRGS